MKTAIEKPVTPSGVFDHLMVPQGDEPEFHPSKDPKTMTMQEFLEEVDRFLCWNRMTPEEKRAEQEAQRAASHATEQAAGDIPCTMRPERVPDTPQDTVWEDLTDAPQDVVRADMLDTSMDGMLEAVPSNGAPERAADTMLDDVPDATEGNVPGREADTVPDGPPDDLPDTVEGNMPDARHNLVTILKRLPVGEKAIVFVELGDDLAEMETIFGDTAAYYCSPFNERYRKKYSDLSVCVKDGRQLKDILFTTKAMGVGIGLKDRGVKHIFIDQWNPLEIAQSLGRKHSLDADDTCTVYFRDYSLDWYWGTNSGLKKFRSMLLNKYLPAQAYMAGKEEFDKYLHSDNPEAIQKKIDKSKILEHNVVTGYHINPLGLQQVEHDIEMLDDIMSSTNYPESFMKYAMFNLHQPIKAYRFKDLEDWLYAHLNQPMDSEEMTEKIMSFGYIERYQGREPGQMGLNKFLPCYGVKIVSDRENKRNENRNKTFWTLMKQ